MATLTIQDYLNKRNMQRPLAQYVDTRQFPYMKYVMNFRLSDLQLTFVRVQDGHYYTEDIRKKLDSLTNGFFTAMYGQREIAAYVYASARECYVGFVLEVRKENHEVSSYIEDFNLSANDIEYLYERVSVYENEHDLPNQLPRYSVGDILHDTLGLCDFIPQDAPYEPYRTVVHILLDDMTDYILAQRSPDDGTMLDSEIVSDAFWHCLVCRLQEENSTSQSES